ncbi:MAG: TIGR02996 domain-containing protein [Myxococcota bacterium]
MTLEAELLEAVYASPDSDEPREALADWWLERGNPRGEFLAAQLRRHRSDGVPWSRRRTPIAPAEQPSDPQALRTWFGPTFARHGVQFDRGFPASVGWHDASRADELGFRTARAMSFHHAVPASATRILREPALNNVEAVSLQRIQAAHYDDLQHMTGTLRRLGVSHALLVDDFAFERLPPVELLSLGWSRTDPWMLAQLRTIAVPKLSMGTINRIPFDRFLRAIHGDVQLLHLGVWSGGLVFERTPDGMTPRLRAPGGASGVSLAILRWLHAQRPDGALQDLITTGESPNAYVIEENELRATALLRELPAAPLMVIYREQVIPLPHVAQLPPLPELWLPRGPIRALEVEAHPQIGVRAAFVKNVRIGNYAQ